MNKKVSILGAGESGVGAALLAKAKGYEVFVSDGGALKEKYRQELQEAGIDFEEGQHSFERILEADEIIKSPGIPHKAPIIQAAIAQGIRISSEIDFASRYTKACIVAITGTNGKTTTTLLTYHLLKTAGLDVALAGNVGDSFAKKVLERDYAYFVLEISSFQLDDIHTFRPNIGILLNITPDHLDRYGYDMEQYITAKFRMIEYMRIGDLFIYNADDENIARRLNRTNVAVATELFTSAFYQQGVLSIPSLGYLDIHANVQSSGKIEFSDLALRGKHNGMNMSAAVMAAMRLGISSTTIAEGLRTFVNAPHRLEKVGVVNGVTFINDSKATNVDAAFFALDSFEQPIVWIAGGVDKGNDYEQIRHLVQKNVKAIVCLGVDNAKIFKAFAETVDFIDETQDINEAVQKAYHLAESKDIVLLAPACASFDLFKNYEDRGNQFREAVRKLKDIRF